MQRLAERRMIHGVLDFRGTVDEDILARDFTGRDSVSLYGIISIALL